MKKSWMIAVGFFLTLVLVLLVLFLMPSGDGSGRGAKIEEMFYKAVQDYEGRESVEVHWTLTYVSKDGAEIQNDSCLWRHGENWLLETVVPYWDDEKIITQLQYGEQLFTETDGAAYCQTTILPGVGQVKYAGFDTWEQTEDDGWKIYWEGKPTDAQKNLGIYHTKGSMEVDKNGDLVRILTQDYYQDRPGHLEKDFTIVPCDDAVCREKIETAYQQLKAAVEGT